MLPWYEVTRGRGKLHKKLSSPPDTTIKEEVVRVTDSTNEGKPTNTTHSINEEKLLHNSMLLEQCTEHSNVHNIGKALFISKTDLDVVDRADLSLQNEASAVHLEKDANTAASIKDTTTVGGECVSLSKKSSKVSMDDVNPLLSKAEELTEKLKSSTVCSKARARIRNVAKLQAILAEKESVKGIHEQARRNKSKQVEEDADAQKIPVKFVPAGPATTKIRSKAKSQTVIQSVPASTHTVVPEFVLPTHQTPVKNSVDELELEEKKHILEYGKASRLVDEVKNNSTLPLPRSYERLHDSFQSCDRLSRTFARKQLAQIMYVYPTSYDIRVEKQWNPFGGESRSRGKFELVMAANLNDDLEGYMLPDTFSKVDNRPVPKVTPVKLLSPRKKVVTVMPRDPVPDVRPRLEGWRMTCRSHIFKHKLIEIVKKFHQRFLQRVGLQLNDTEHARLRRFHPKFDLDQECEEIIEADLPRVPSEDGETHLEMKDYLEAVDTSAPLPKAVATVIEELKSPCKKLVSSCSGTPLSPRKFAEQRALRPNKSMTLIERIRAKEAAKKLADSLRDPAVERKAEVLQRITNGLLRCITTYFAFKKVRSMDVNLLAEQIMRSQSAMNRVLIMEHITALCETASQYMAIVEISGKKYLQLKENNYAAIEKIVQDELVRLRNDKSSMTVTNPPADVNQNLNCLKKSVSRALF
ncbi:DNA replication factor CDT1 like protein [Dictyocaulus viviparus]|uniref:DNA replication factor CDT1 like protein n=1 Tax=Dictyocaulus viviparus TaxID=29172 RepID=A0A0D8Y8V6_DICVI|nr:DNA replication factor CDT1 like protein [Dictyocaulus viviparus]